MLEWFKTIIEVKVYFALFTILFHVGLQTLVNHYHRMKADQEHTEQLRRIEEKLDKRSF